MPAKEVRYAVYNTDEELVFEGTAKEIAKYLGVSASSIKSRCCRLRKSETYMPYQHSIYRVYDNDEDEEE